MMTVKSLCVFCGSSMPKDPHYRALADCTGRLLAEQGIQVVYGGGHVGMMGTVADAALAAGGRVVGVIPEYLVARELGHGQITELRVVDSMHTRKQTMFELSDGFIILPGGFGTLEEAFEVITWKQIGMHDKPIAIIDGNGYWAPLISLMDEIVATGFARPSVRDVFTVVDSPEEALTAISASPEATIAAVSDRF